MRSLIGFGIGMLVIGSGILGARAGQGSADAAATQELKIQAFALKDASGKTWSLADSAGKSAVVVLFLGTECPINNAYMPRLVELHAAYAEKGVAFVGINSNPQDGVEDVARHVKAHKLPFPILKDTEQKVLAQFAAERTPEAFLLDPSGVVRYRGRIDDQFGIDFKRPKPTREDLVDALDELLAGKPVSVARTERRAASSPGSRSRRWRRR